MEQVIGSGTMEIVAQWGVIPLLITCTVILWRKVQTMEKASTKQHEEHKNDLRLHAEEMKGLQQNTINAINDITRKR